VLPPVPLSFGAASLLQAELKTKAKAKATAAAVASAM